MQERILQTTDRLFYEQGIRAVGVDTVAAEVGISKRTLYNYYPSKDELIAAYLSRRFRPMELTDQPAAEQILGNFDRLERSFASDRFRGCPFVNAVAELKEPATCRERDRARLQGRAARLVPRTAVTPRCGGSGRSRDAADAAGRRRDRGGGGAWRSESGARRASAAATLLTCCGCATLRAARSSARPEKSRQTARPPPAPCASRPCRGRCATARSRRCAARSRSGSASR